MAVLRRSLVFLAVSSVAAALCSCENSTDARAIASQVTAQTADTIFVRPSGFDRLLSIPVTVGNNSGAPVFVSCYPSLEKLVDQQWKVVIEPFCSPSNVGPLRLMPGDSFTTYVDGLDSPTASPRVDLSNLGERYRTRLGIFAGAEFPGNEMLQLGSMQFLISNEFTLSAHCLAFPGPPPSGCI